MNEIKITGRDPHTGAGMAVTVQDGCIARIEPARVEENCWLAPGLIDLQVNGYHGFDLNDDAMTAATVSALARAMLATGVTSFAPTLITASQQQIVTRLRVIAGARAADPIAAACIPFVHVEGPYISPLDGYRGAHPLEHVRPPSLDEFHAWQQASGNIVGIVTLSPHFGGTPAYIAALVASGVHVSIGHTHATAAEIHAAVDAGATLSTHLGNGLPSLLARHPNPIWTQLADDRLHACFIADGHHLPAETLQAMLRAKTLDRGILVSDAVALAGMTPGRYTSPIGGEVELAANGRLGMVGSTNLAGAAVPLVECIGHAVRMTGLPLASILKLATENPGRLIQNSSTSSCPRGQVVEGMRADLLQFQWDEPNSAIRIQNVWLAGSRQTL